MISAPPLSRLGVCSLAREQNIQFHRDGAGEDQDYSVSPTATEGTAGPQAPSTVSRRQPTRRRPGGTIRIGRFGLAYEDKFVMALLVSERSASNAVKHTVTSPPNGNVLGDHEAFCRLKRPPVSHHGAQILLVPDLHGATCASGREALRSGARQGCSGAHQRGERMG